MLPDKEEVGDKHKVGGYQKFMPAQKGNGQHDLIVRGCYIRFKGFENPEVELLITKLKNPPDY